MADEIKKTNRGLPESDIPEGGSFLPSDIPGLVECDEIRCVVNYGRENVGLMLAAGGKSIAMITLPRLMWIQTVVDMEGLYNEIQTARERDNELVREKAKLN